MDFVAMLFQVLCYYVLVCICTCCFGGHACSTGCYIVAITLL